MRAVVDTNVLVSGLLKQGTPPAEVIADVLSGVLVVLYDQRIIDEYRDVLARPKFAIAPEQAQALVEFIVADGVEVAGAHFAGQLADVGDQPFADVAFGGKADLLITGNAKDFLVGRAIRVVTPRDWLGIRKSVRLLQEFGEDERAGGAAPVLLKRRGPPVAGRPSVPSSCVAGPAAGGRSTASLRPSGPWPGGP